MIEQERMLLVTKSAALVLHLEENSESLTLDLQKIIFQYDSETNITSVDFGHSPWSEKTISMNMGDEGLLIIGEEDGSILGWHRRRAKKNSE